MIIHGREVGLRFTSGASAEIAKLCPNNDIGRMDELFADTSNVPKMLDLIASMAAALNKGYELNKKYEQPGYEPNPISVEELMTLDMDELLKLEEDIISVMGTQSKGEIETETPKGAKKK